MAIALTWSGRVDLDLQFDQFFNSNHTISAWFMPQFPDSYINSIVSVGPPGPPKPGVLDQAPGFTDFSFYLMGTGEYKRVTKPDKTIEESPRMFLKVGEKKRSYDVDLKRDKWHHVAVVRSGNKFTMFFNGTALTPALTIDAKSATNSRLRLGQSMAWRQIQEKRPAQFYGLIDDVAVFTEALSASEIATLAKKNTKITGEEPGLLAAWLFSKTQETHKKLKRKFTLAGSATKVEEAQPRSDHKDKQLQPMPSSKFHFKLPFKDNQLIFVGQGPHSLGGSHFGSRNFPYDFAPIVISETGDPVESRVKIAGAPFVAVSDGKVVLFEDGHSSGDIDGTNTMFVSIDGLPGFFWKHLHWETGSATVKKNDKVKAGDVLANAGDTGVDEKNFHLHTALVFFPDGQQPPDTDETSTTVSVPVGFIDYQRLTRVKDEDGNEEDIWEPVELDIPEKPEILATGFLKMKDFFKEPLTKLELNRFRDFAKRKGLGTHRFRNEM